MTTATPTAGMASDDQALGAALARCADGDRNALREIYVAHAGVMLGIALRILRRRDMAEEAVHDAFVRVFQHAGTFDAARGSARAWLFTIVRNRALNIVRGEARTELVDDFEPMGIEDEAETPEAIVARMSDVRSLKRCLEILTPDRRNLIVMAYTQGLTHGEIAGRLKLPLGTVKTWIRRALLALRECLA